MKKTKKSKKVFLNNGIEQNSWENIDWKGVNWSKREFSHPERTIRVATTFSGIGATEYALKRLGVNHEIVFACDIDKMAKKSFFANYDITEDKWFDDITKLDATPFKGKVDILQGSSPCQSFSMSGKRKGMDDIRGMLFESYVKVIRDCEPKVFIFENVEGMLSQDKGRSWEVIRKTFADLGYDIHYQVLDARDYGVAQARRRLFCIGFKKKTNFLFPAPIKLEKCLLDYIEPENVENMKKGETIQYTLTPREHLNLMGFDNDYKIVVPNGKAKFQAGNSIVVDVMMALFRQMDVTQYGTEK